MSAFWITEDEFVFLIAGQYWSTSRRSEDVQWGAGADLEEVWAVGNSRAALQ